MTELLPCPFCGGCPSEDTSVQHQSGDLRCRHSFGCFNVSCPIRPSASRWGPWGYHQKGDPPNDEAAKAEALAAWNHRVPTASSSAASDEVPGTPSNLECDGESAATESQRKSEGGVS